MCRDRDRDTINVNITITLVDLNWHRTAINVLQNESAGIRQKIVKLERGRLMKKLDWPGGVYSCRDGRWDWACGDQWRWQRASRVGETMFNREPHQNIFCSHRFPSRRRVALAQEVTRNSDFRTKIMSTIAIMCISAWPIPNKSFFMNTMHHIIWIKLARRRSKISN